MAIYMKTNTGYISRIYIQGIVIDNCLKQVIYIRKLRNQGELFLNVEYLFQNAPDLLVPEFHRIISFIFKD